MDNNNVFLNNIRQNISAGEYDILFTSPFQTRRLFYASIKAKIEKRIANGGTPVLTDEEIKLCASDMKATSAEIYQILIKSGILEKNKSGECKLSRKGELAIKSIYGF